LLAPVINVTVMRSRLAAGRRAIKGRRFIGLAGPPWRVALRDHGRVDASELSACLRTWRDRLQPSAAGLPAGGARRAPGLRREEVAHLAGLSVDYLARLEQGRARRPSPSVLGALARALRLTQAERAHLFRTAGHAEPARGSMRRDITPGVQRVLDRLRGVPVLVSDAGWTIVAANPLASALLDEPTGTGGHDDNVAWRHFTGAPSRVVRSAAETARAEEELVADLHDAVGRFPDDEQLAALMSRHRR
jgi:transcriptional regulator with XRE-family HTH domain